MEPLIARKRGGQPGNASRVRGAKLQEALWKAVRANNFERLDRMCASITERAAEGDLACASFIYDRIIGRPMPALPDVDSDRAVSITWSFGPAAMEHQPSQALDLPRVSSAQPGDDLPG
jgi:hypothetical protein